jgi:hypothetical protein
MRPATLADLVCRIYVEAFTGAELLHQLAAELGIASLLIACAFYLSEPIMCSANHELIKPNTLSAASQRIQCLLNWRGLGDGVAGTTGWHESSVALGAAPKRPFAIRPRQRTKCLLSIVSCPW